MSNSQVPAGAALAQEHRDATQGYHDRTSGLKDAPAPASSVEPNSVRGRKATVPKFGGWQETGHAPAEGYTVVFDKVKEKKQQTAHATLTAAPAPNGEPETYHQRTGQTLSQPKSFWTKLFGCFAPSAN